MINAFCPDFLLFKLKAKNILEVKPFRFYNEKHVLKISVIMIMLIISQIKYLKLIRIDM